MRPHWHFAIYISCCLAALIEPAEYDLKNIGVRERAQNLNYCEASYGDWLFAITCDATTQPYNVDFFIDDAPQPQELYLVDIPSVVNKTSLRPNILYIHSKPSVSNPAKIIIRDAGIEQSITSQSITAVRANSQQDEITHIHVNIGDVMKFQDYKMNNIDTLYKTNGTEVLAETKALIQSTYISKAKDVSNKTITSPRDTFVQKSEEWIDIKPETYDVYDDNLMRIVRKQVLNTQKTGNKYVDVIEMSCCDFANPKWTYTVSTLYYIGQNSMNHYIVKRDLKYGDTIYNTNQIISKQDFPDPSRIGTSYKMVVFDKDANNIGETSFTIILYQWQVIRNQEQEYQVQMQKEQKSKQYLKYWSLLDAKVTWDFMAVVANYNRIKIFTLDDLREINSISNANGQIQKRFGIELIQRQNMLMEFHVEKENDSDDAYVMMNKLIFTQNNDGSLPDLKKNSNPASFIWSRYIKISQIKLSQFTRIASLMGGMSIGWLDRTERKFKALRICSQNEFYHSETETCKKCFEKTLDFPEGKLNFLKDPKDSNSYLSNNGFSPYYSSSIQDSNCYSCSQLEFFKSYDLQIYMDFKFLCLHGDDFISESSEVTIKGNNYVPTKGDKFTLMADISDNISILQLKEKEQKGIVDVTVSFFRSLGSDQKNLMLVIIVGLSVCACCSMFCFWCCRERQSVEEDTTDEEENIPNNSAVDVMVNRNKENSPAKVMLIRQQSEERNNIINAIKKLLKVEQFKSAKNNGQNYDIIGNNVIYDTSCSICMENFDEDQEILQTPCNHSFHEACLMDWINVRIDKILKEKRKQNIQADPVTAPDCPNCNQSLTKAAEAVEREAINQINQIGGLLSSSMSMVDHNDVQAQV